jgi:hypothetical protein
VSAIFHLAFSLAAIITGELRVYAIEYEDGR